VQGVSRGAQDFFHQETGSRVRLCWRMVSLGLSQGKGGRQGETDESVTACKSEVM